MSRLFDTDIVISGKRGDAFYRSTVRACQMDGSFDQPLSGDAVETKRRCYTFVIHSADVPGFVPKVGDTITTKDGRAFSVRRVQPFYSREYVLDVRTA